MGFNLPQMFRGAAPYTVLHGPDIAPGEPFAGRTTYEEVVLTKRLREPLARINPKIPAEAIDEAILKVLRTKNHTLEENSRRFRPFLADGVPVEHWGRGLITHDYVHLVDFDGPSNNDWLAVNQFTVIEDKNNRQPDIVALVNGLPLGVFESKNLADEDTMIKDAFSQFLKYEKDFPSLSPFNEVLVISDGLESLIGTLTSGREWFMPW